MANALAILSAGTVTIEISNYKHVPCSADKYSMISECEDSQPIIVLTKLDGHRFLQSHFSQLNV